MVLYCVQHSAGIIKAIVHKFKYHPQDDAVFFTDRDVSSRYCPSVNKIKYYQMPDPYEIARYSSNSQEEVKKHTNQILSDFFKGKGLEPLQFSHIYALFDEYNPFALYFEMSSIRYMSVETADSFFSDNASGRYISHLMFMHPETYAYNCLARDMHLNDTYGKNCTKAYLFSEKSRYDTAKGTAAVETFGYYEALIRLDDKSKRQLIKGYDMERYDFDTVLLLSSPLFTKGCLAIHEPEMLSETAGEEGLDGAGRFYKTMIDYYFSDVDFALKLHSETDESLAKAFCGFKQIPSELPTELLLLWGKKPDIICPDLGTELEFFKEHGFNVTVFGSRVFDFYKMLHFIFLAFTLINAIGLPEKITVSGIDISQLELFKSIAYKDLREVETERLRWHNVWDAGFIIAEPSDDFTEIIKNAPEDCLIFVNGEYEADSAFSVQKMLYSVIDVSGGEPDELQSSGWVVLSKNRELVDMVSEFSASYTLDTAQVMIQSSPLA